MRYGEETSDEVAFVVLDRFARLRCYVPVDRQMKYDCLSLRAERCSTLSDCYTWVGSQIAINTSATRGGSGIQCTSLHDLCHQMLRRVNLSDKISQSGF
jgi:hypothetical protein